MITVPGLASEALGSYLSTHLAVASTRQRRI